MLCLNERLIPIFKPINHGTGVGRFANDFSREGMAGWCAFALDATNLKNDSPVAAVANAAVQGELKCIAKGYVRTFGERDLN